MAESRITFRIDSSVKKEAQIVLEGLGLTLAQALREYLITVTQTNDLCINRFKPAGTMAKATEKSDIHGDDWLRAYEEELASYQKEFAELITPTKTN